MRLKKISLLIFIFFILLFIFFISAFFATFLLASYGDLEKKYMEKDLTQAVNVLNEELITLSHTASDWADGMIRLNL